MKPPTERTTKHPVMACPVCALTICADLTYELKIEPLGLAAGGGREIKLDASAQATRFNLHHSCPGVAESDEAPR